MADNKKPTYRKAHMTPSSPPYAPYAAYMDPHTPPPQAMYDPNDPSTPATFAYIYPVSPQFSVQYYTTTANTSGSESSSRYQSYPGSPVLHPALQHYQLSPPLIPSSPPFSPNIQYHSSPPTHAFMMPAGHQQHFPPPLHLSPILTSTNSASYVQPYDLKKRQEQLEQEYVHLTSFHPQNIYVRGLPATETDDSFLDLCQVYGPISSHKAIIDQKTGECKGYGFAMYQDQNDCQVAIHGLNAAGYQASLARVGQESFSSRLRSLQDETSTNIYISNLPVTMDEQGLEQLFQPYQTVSNRILRDPQSGMSRGVGFARLADRQSASAIIDNFNGHSINGSSAPLQVRFADSPAQKRLKSQTTTAPQQKKVTNLSAMRNQAARDLFPCGFPSRNMMPVTPETMLGIAPSQSTNVSYPRLTAVEPQNVDAAVEHQRNMKDNVASTK